MGGFEGRDLGDVVGGCYRFWRGASCVGWRRIRLLRRRSCRCSLGGSGTVVVSEGVMTMGRD